MLVLLLFSFMPLQADKRNEDCPAEPINLPSAIGKHDNKHNPHYESGLDSLRHAVWTPEDNVTLQQCPGDLQPGLDALRFAEWGMEIEQATSRYGLTETVNSVERIFPGDEALEQDGYGPEAAKEPAGIEYVTNIETKYQRLDTNLSVLEIHKMLEQMYPKVCTKRLDQPPEDFPPHMVVGTVPLMRISSVLSRLAERWFTVYFRVNAVHIVTIDKKKHTMKIKHKIPFQK